MVLKERFQPTSSYHSQNMNQTRIQILKKGAQKKDTNKPNQIDNRKRPTNRVIDKTRHRSLITLGGRQLLVRVHDEEDVINNGGDGPADQWANPVHPLVGPGPAHQCGSK